MKFQDMFAIKVSSGNGQHGAAQTKPSFSRIHLLKKKKQYQRLRILLPKKIVDNLDYALGDLITLEVCNKSNESHFTLSLLPVEDTGCPPSDYPKLGMKLTRIKNSKTNSKRSNASYYLTFNIPEEGLDRIFSSREARITPDYAIKEQTIIFYLPK